MSGNNERLTIEDSRDLFRHACPHCREARGFYFRIRNGNSCVFVEWPIHKDTWSAFVYDRRTTYNSFWKHPVMCASCWAHIESKEVVSRLIMMVKKGVKRWHREYKKEFGGG